MSISNGIYPKGSEWRLWDLHIHSPASFEWNGKKFSYGCDTADDKVLIDEMIEALNVSAPSVFGLMDYWDFRGWFALKKRLKENDSPVLIKTVFPGIELRVAAPMNARLNIHAIFSDKIKDQDLINFRAKLRLELIDKPLSKDGLMEYARHVSVAKLKEHGFSKQKVDGSDDEAYKAGCMIAEIKVESYKEAVVSVPNDMCRGFVAFTTNDGLNDIDRKDHYAYVMELFESSPIFETRTDSTWNALVGRKIPSNEKWFDDFFDALGGIPRLPVAGSDGHSFKGNAQKNIRGYGDFPSGQATWIKADPTWQGLLQAIREPEKRCFIGKFPIKNKKISENKTFYIDSLSINKKEKSSLKEDWLDGVNIKFNPDLVAIIGNRGSGKSALADILALLGNSQNHDHFSFLKPDRFLGKSGEPAKHFEGSLSWLAGETITSGLHEKTSPNKVELVKYIPQGRFENLCNDHVSGKTKIFEDELRNVIFSHISESDRQGSLNFEELIVNQEQSFRSRLDENRKKLRKLNWDICNIEEKLDDRPKKKIEELLTLKDLQLKEHIDAKPKEIKKPIESLSEDQKAAQNNLTILKSQEIELTNKKNESLDKLKLNAEQIRSIQEIMDYIDIFHGQYKELKENLKAPLATLGGDVDKLIDLKIDVNWHKNIKKDIVLSGENIIQESVKIGNEIEGVVRQIKLEETKLDAPNKVYQEYINELQLWEEGRLKIIGIASSPETIEGLKQQLVRIAGLPNTLELHRKSREGIVREIHKVLSAKREARAKLFSPLQKILKDDDIIKLDFDLQFEANLQAYHDAISENIFSLIKQNYGSLRGDEESRLVIKEIVDSCDFNIEDSVVTLVLELEKVLLESAHTKDINSSGLTPIMRKDKLPIDVYDFIFNLDYLTPKYTLLFQSTPIEQLSPGQRGALLLIFYLLVDTGRNPIILDQPEENLDNETIVTLLVPVVCKAKEKRQIIMVTHNPNLAVVCDAEQIIYSDFNRKGKFKISYFSGSIEDDMLNKCVVTVLEGTKPAFDNRKNKYL